MNEVMSIAQQKAWEAFLAAEWPSGLRRSNYGSMRWHTMRTAFLAGWSARKHAELKRAWGLSTKELKGARRYA